jgi:hypothetical protein
MCEVRSVPSDKAIGTCLTSNNVLTGEAPLNF